MKIPGHLERRSKNKRLNQYVGVAKQETRKDCKNRCETFRFVFILTYELTGSQQIFRFNSPQISYKIYVKCAQIQPCFAQKLHFMRHSSIHSIYLQQCSQTLHFILNS